MRISDWSSDVCSSDLFCGLGVHFIGNKNFGHVLLLCPSSPRSGVHVHSVAKCRKWLPTFAGMTMYSVKTYARAVAQAQSSQGPRASMSAASTVAPHQMRSPGGARG